MKREWSGTFCSLAHGPFGRRKSVKRLLIGLLAVLSFTACGTQEDAAAQQKREQQEPATLAAVPNDAKARSGLKTSRSALSTLASDAIVWDDECFALSLPQNDDSSSGSITLPFSLNFFGNTTRASTSTTTAT